MKQEPDHPQKAAAVLSRINPFAFTDNDHGNEDTDVALTPEIKEVLEQLREKLHLNLDNALAAKNGTSPS